MPWNDHKSEKLNIAIYTDTVFNCNRLFLFNFLDNQDQGFIGGHRMIPSSKWSQRKSFIHQTTPTNGRSPFTPQGPWLFRWWNWTVMTFFPCPRHSPSSWSRASWILMRWTAWCWTRCKTVWPVNKQPVPGWKTMKLAGKQLGYQECSAKFSNFSVGILFIVIHKSRQA